MMKKIGILAGVGAALVAVLVLAGSAFAAGGVSVSNGEAEDGDSGTVSVDLQDVGGEGLGAWTIDISYDTDLLTATDCEAEQGGVCNADFEAGMVRVTGASAGGLSGDKVLGTFTFECDGEGESDLTISLSVFSDATIGEPQDLISEASNSNGTFTCGEIEEDTPVPADTPVVPGLPPTGTGVVGSDGSSFSWLIALIAVIGVAVLATGYGVARSRA